MKNDLLTERPILGKRLLSYAADLISVVISTVIIYFVILYSVFGVGFNYINNASSINKIENSYSLKIRYGEEYKVYEKVIQDFYFTQFRDEILEDYKKEGKNYSIEYIYNVTVLRLPDTPTSEYFSTMLYRYKVTNDGSYDLNSLGEQVEGSGSYFERNLMDLFYDSYESLPSLLRKYDQKYNQLILDNIKSEAISRLIAFIISIIIYFIIIPLVNKNSSTFFERLLKIGYVNSTDHLKIKTYKVFLRPIIYFILPCLVIYGFTAAGVVIMGVLPFFINFLVMLLNKENKDLYELFTKSITCDLEVSSIFSNQKEADEFMKKENINDIDFVENLKNIDKIDENKLD